MFLTPFRKYSMAFGLTQVFLEVMVLKRRLISTVLVVVVLCSMICIAPSASAVTPWEHFVEVLGQSALNFGQVDFSMSDFIFPITGECTEEDLLFAQDRYNSWLATTLRTGSMIGSAFDAFFNTHRAIIVEDTVNNRRRLQDGTSGEWIVDYSGKYPYVSIASNDTVPDWATKPAPDCPSAPEFSPKTENSWLELAPIQTKLNSGLLSGNTSYNYNQLTDLLNGLRDRSPNVNYRLAPVFGGSYGVCKNNLVLCDVAGRPFIAFKEEASSAANQTQNVYVKNDGGGDLIVGGDKVTTDIKILDKSENTVTIPVTNDNSTNVTIDNLIHQNIYDTSYNFDDHSYTVNTYDVTYNNDNRRYQTNYYTWNITYNITNTYVTYIGSNDAYQQKGYEFYYELPDGRSSADLTADEVAAMSFQFADCMNYQRSATDTNLRALYHFDGDLSDSGYFSDKTAFTWQQGASITYMDSSTFNGALYLDDTSHSFDIMLSNGISSSSDFSLQWRYYQASEPDTVTNIENWLSLNGSEVLKWDERKLYKGSTELCYLPLGNWIELALIKHSGTLYLYLNGVKVNTLAAPATALKQISFHFGSTSRAYSMLDELRIIDFACATDGENYTPTAVPYDTNLVLTLPGEEAVVDEYWQYVSPNNLFARPFFTDDGDYVSFPTTSSSTSSSACVNEWTFLSSGTSYSPSSYSLDDSCLTLSSVSSSDFKRYSSSNMNIFGFYYGLYCGYSSTKFATGISFSKSYTFSVVDTSGQVYSLTFTMPASRSSGYTSARTSATFSWGKLCFDTFYDSSRKDAGGGLFVVPAAGKSISIAYMELVAGSSSQVVATKVTSVFDLSTLKPNTAAVQTDIPIHGYTVGGVRPTFPARGDVWFGVTNGRVSSVQVYTGSAWTSSNARWWTGERWIPIYAFDIFTLEDCWDIADSGDVITPIESDTAGWNWWKKAWTDFRSWLGGVFGSGSGGGGSGGGDYTYPSVYPSAPVDNPSFEDDDGTKTTLWDFPGKLFSSLWGLLSGLVDVVAGGVGGLFSLIGDGVGGFFGSFTGEDGVFQFVTYGGADIWD